MLATLPIAWPTATGLLVLFIADAGSTYRYTLRCVYCDSLTDSGYQNADTLEVTCLNCFTNV